MSRESDSLRAHTNLFKERSLNVYNLCQDSGIDNKVNIIHKNNEKNFETFI